MATWEPGNSLFVTINCWGRLVSGVGASLGKGSPVIVTGHLYTSEYEDRDGNQRSTLEMRAISGRPRSVPLYRAGGEDRLVRDGDRGARGLRRRKSRTARIATIPMRRQPLPLSA